MGRPRKPLNLSAPTTHINVSLPTPLVAELDALAAELNRGEARAGGEASFATAATRSTALALVATLGLKTRSAETDLEAREAAVQQREAALATREGAVIRDRKKRKEARVAAIYRDAAIRRGRRAVGRGADDSPLGLSCYAVLGALLMDGTMSVADLERRLGRSADTMGRAARTLEAGARSSQAALSAGG